MQYVGMKIKFPKYKTLIQPNYLSDFRSKRIIGGNYVNQNQYPWVAGLYTRRFSDHPYCGATLISSRHLITAAHCIEGRYKMKLTNFFK